MKSLLKLARLVDSALARTVLRLGFERTGLVTLCCHGVFTDEEEARNGAVDPFQVLTVADFEAIIGTFRRAGYAFVTGREIAEGRPAGPRAVWLTFDDGYANNLRILPVLERWNAKATIFIAAGPVERARSYWWDVLYRQAGPGAAEASERERLKALPTREIEARLEKRYGAQAFAPLGDVDRPLSVAELQALALHPLIELGNHTYSHAILPRENPADMEAEIRDCQDKLAQWTGRAPITIAYPNGEWTPETVEASRRAGLLVGVTGRPAPCPLPVPEKHRLTIPRIPSFCHERLDAELVRSRTGLSLRWMFETIAAVGRGAGKARPIPSEVDFR